MHRNTNGARLVSNRARNRLTNPPCRIGREFIATAIFKFINRLHQADIAFLNEVKELQTAIGVFFGNRNDQAQIGLDHFFFGDTRFALTFLHGADNATVFRNIKTGLIGQFLNFIANVFYLITVFLNKGLPPFARQAADTARPIGLIFIALILFEKILARDAGFLRETPKLGFQPDQALIDGVKLLNQCLNTIIIERQPLHLINDFTAQFVEAVLLRRAQLFILCLQFNALVLQTA
ncbi:MAG: Uncharacterised protein [Alphaproteobacteria bacterium]|nr:MAG: Uncharacterised protein [Alphaproteobacteria bacterium]